MPNTIEQATRSSLGMSTTAPSSVTSYTHDMAVPGFPGLTVPTLVIDGTDGADTINGASATNYIFGFGGNDILRAYTGTTISPAILCGGNGADTFTFISASTNLTLTGNVLDFSAADGDQIDLSGTGLAFADLTITATSGNSYQILATGVNLNIVTTDGSVNVSNVIVTSGAGTGNNDENTPSADNDLLTGTSAADIIRALAGDDTITGSDGNDDINGQADDDSILGGDGDDTLLGGQGNDTVNGNMDSDSVNGQRGDDSVMGGRGDDLSVHGGQDNDTVNGNDGSDNVFGDLGNDTLHGGKNDDSISGGGGVDLIFGDLGNDTLTGGDGADWFIFSANFGTDVVTDFVTGTDKLQFNSSVFATEADVVAAFSGGVITTDDGTVTLTGITSLTVTDVDIL